MFYLYFNKFIGETLISNVVVTLLKLQTFDMFDDVHYLGTIRVSIIKIM